jgi:hypothetical protein
MFGVPELLSAFGAHSITTTINGSETIVECVEYS